MSILIKPPVGARINPYHPIADKLIFYSLMNDYSGKYALNSAPRKNMTSRGSVFTGAPTISTNNKAGRGTYFDATDDMIRVIPRFSGHILGTSPMTAMVIWEKPVWGVADDTQYMFCDWRIGDSSWNRGWSVINHSSYTYTRRILWTMYGSTETDGCQVICNASLNAAQIYHTVCVRDGQDTSKQKIFIDGAQVASTILQDYSWTGVSTVSGLEGDNYIGGRYNNPISTPDHLFKGNIYAVGFWDRVLSPQEIASLYNSPWQMFDSTPSYRKGIFIPKSGFKRQQLYGQMNGQLSGQGVL